MEVQNKHIPSAYGIECMYINTYVKNILIINE